MSAVAPGAADLIVRGRHVVCRVRPDGTPVIVDGGGVLVLGAAVVEVADFDALARTHPRATVIGDGGDVVFPGLAGSCSGTGTPSGSTRLRRGRRWRGCSAAGRRTPSGVAATSRGA